MSAILFHNARIWRECGNLYSWMIFSQASGKVLKCGSGDVNLDNSDVNLVVDMKKRWIFPGFHDCHLHISHLGKFVGKCNLNMPTTVDELKDRLKMLSRNLSSDEWLICYGFDQEIMDRTPTREDIDSIVADNPVVLWRICLHSCIVNTPVVLMTEITKNTKDPEHGTIGRYPDDHPQAGEANGFFSEDGAVKLIFAVLPDPSSKQKKEHILSGLQHCLQQGLTSVHTCDSDYWESYVDLAKSGGLPIHCYCSPFSSDFGSSNFPTYAGESYENLTCDFVKIFIDGALRIETALLSVPYLRKNADGSDNYGILQKTENQFAELVTKINEAGFRIEIHVIGDKAAEIALNLLEKCKVSPTKRPLFVHCQILRNDFLDRMRKCGVVPTIQPSMVPTDASWLRSNLPEQLKSCIYPWKTLLSRGLICGGSSDAPVETVNPLIGIHDAIFRLSPEGVPFGEKECLTFQEAVKLYTTGSAFADGVESFKGQLEEGFQADIVVLKVPCSADGIPLDLAGNPNLLKETTVHEVWQKGRKVWSSCD